MSILVTGGTGYIGSHTVVELLNSGEDVIIVDNLYNSKLTVLNKIEKITGKRPKFYHEDAADRAAMDKIFAENSIEAVIHFAGLKAVGESVRKPLDYYRVNLDTAVVTMETMRKYGCKCFIFSSSATVYGEPKNSTDPRGFSRRDADVTLRQDQADDRADYAGRLHVGRHDVDGHSALFQSDRRA